MTYVDAINQSNAGGAGASASAKAILADALAQYGLSALADWAWSEYLTSGANDVGQAMTLIMPKLRERPEYQARFPAMKQLSADGHAMSEAEYMSYETSVTQIMRAAGLPEGFYDSPDDFKNFLTAQVSPVEVQERVKNAQAAIYTASPATKSALASLYQIGLTPGEVTAYFLDPEKAQPILNRQFAAAQISGRGSETGFGGLSRAEAESIANRGLSPESVDQGFQTLVRSEELFGALPGSGDDTIDRGDQLGAAFGGDVGVQERIAQQAEKRKAAFQGGGQYSSDKTGFSGLGSGSR